MAASATLAVAAVSAGYSAITSSHQAREQQKRSDEASTLITSQARDAATKQADTTIALGNQAGIAQKRKASPIAPSSTILTSPQGVSTPAPGQKQLTGL